MKLCVLGLGYIGLPTAVMFSKHGVIVHGVDVNEEVIAKLQNKQLHIFEPGLEEMLIESMDNGSLTVSTEPVAADAYIIAVPTPLNPDKSANLNYVRSATEMIVPYLEKGNLVVLESTVPPKTVEDVMIPILQKSGLEIGEELFVSHSPERVMPGKLFEELVSNDRTVGGINEQSSQMTVDLYKHFVKGKIHVTDATTAEMVKLMENTYRDINIAFANELARIAEKLDFNVWEAIELANHHPRVNIHLPGPGVGGHCIAIDPWFIIDRAEEESKLVSLSRQINESTPYEVARLIEQQLEGIQNPTVAILGLAFKGNIDDMRESPSLTIIGALQEKNITCKIYDPHVTEHVEGKVSTLEEAATDSDCLVILTDHDEFKEIDFEEIRSFMRTPMVFDTRNIVKSNALKEEWIFNQVGFRLQRGVMS